MFWVYPTGTTYKQMMISADFTPVRPDELAADTEARGRKRKLLREMALRPGICGCIQFKKRARTFRPFSLPWFSWFSACWLTFLLTAT